MPRVRIDDHTEWLIRLDPDGTEAHPLVEIPNELFESYRLAKWNMDRIQKKLRAIYSAEIQARQEEQMRRQKSAPTAVGEPVETERKEL